MRDPRSSAQKESETLPKTAAVCEQWVRCGKAECRCVNGPLHGPYTYLFYRSGGRLVKQYVRASEVPTLRACIEEHRTERQRVREGWRRFRQLRELAQGGTNGGQ